MSSAFINPIWDLGNFKLALPGLRTLTEELRSPTSTQDELDAADTIELLACGLKDLTDLLQQKTVDLLSLPYEVAGIMRTARHPSGPSGRYCLSRGFDPSWVPQIGRRDRFMGARDLGEFGDSLQESDKPRTLWSGQVIRFFFDCIRDAGNQLSGCSPVSNISWRDRVVISADWALAQAEKGPVGNPQLEPFWKLSERLVACRIDNDDVIRSRHDAIREKVLRPVTKKSDGMSLGLMENIGLYIDSEVLKQCEKDPTIQGGIEIIRQEVINKLRQQLGLCRNFEERNSE